MFDGLVSELAFYLAALFADLGEIQHVLLRLIPFVLFIELPLYLMIFIGICMYRFRGPNRTPAPSADYRPLVSCVITCYAEGDAVRGTVGTLLEQLYPGEIEILAVVDGASQNRETLRALQELQATAARYPRRRLKIIPKWQRGGRVSSLNTGLHLSRGEIIMALDGDTSFDNDMVDMAVARFRDPTVMALAGTLRVRNRRESLCTRLQALEYLIAIHAARVGLAEFNVVNNVSGAFGVFRRSVLTTVGGWDTGSAEDLDLTLRIKRYFGRYRDRRVVFEPRAVGHTDVPATFRSLLQQRLRWDGDLFYIYVRKHRAAFSPRILGWPNLLVTIWYGLLFQLVMPFVILLYTTWVLFTLPLVPILATLILVYTFYLGVTLVFYLVGWLGLSERKRTDARLLPMIVLFPFYNFLLRLWAAVATLAEILLHNHNDSNMAPWWVLKRNRY